MVFLSLLVFSTIGFYYHSELLAGINNIIYFSPCDTPIEYRIGTIDPRFNVSENEFMEDIQEASSIWSNAYGKKLFVYNPQANFPVNLVYDTRQGLNTQINQLENTLQQQNSSLKPKMQEYEQKVSDFNTRLSEFKKQVSYWNSRGGAPPNEYQKLKNEQESLKQEANSLDEMARSLNLSTSQYNSQVKDLNKTINVFNQTLESKPEEGLYVWDKDGQRIDIYFYNSQQEAVHTLAHEMGHALGIGHIEDTAGDLMNAKTNEAVSLSQEDILELQKVCRKRSIFEIIQSRLLALYKQIYKVQN